MPTAVHLWFAPLAVQRDVQTAREMGKAKMKNTLYRGTEQMCEDYFNAGKTVADGKGYQCIVCKK